MLWRLRRRGDIYTVCFRHGGKEHEISTGTMYEDDAEFEAVKIFAQYSASGRYAKPRRLKTFRNRVGIDPWPVHAGVYAATAVGCKHIKIGKASSVAHRMRDMQNFWPTQVELLAVLSRNPTDERQLHEQFAAWHRRGEWFQPNDELSRLIASKRKEGLHLPDTSLQLVEIVNDNGSPLAPQPSGRAPNNP